MRSEVRRRVGSMRLEANRVYTPGELAKELAVSRWTVYRAIESGALEAVRHGTGRGTFRIAGDAAIAYWRACRAAARPAEAVAS